MFSSVLQLLLLKSIAAAVVIALDRRTVNISPYFALFLLSFQVQRAGGAVARLGFGYTGRRTGSLGRSAGVRTPYGWNRDPRLAELGKKDEVHKAVGVGKRGGWKLVVLNSIKEVELLHTSFCDSCVIAMCSVFVSLSYSFFSFLYLSAPLH